MTPIGHGCIIQLCTIQSRPALVHAAHRVEARLEEALAGVGLSIAKFEALSVLVSQVRPISLSELAEKLTCVRSNVTQLVDRLEADGLAKRADDPADRRAVRAKVTALGRKRHAAGAKVVHAVLQKVAKELSTVDPLVLKRAGRRAVIFLTSVHV